MKDRKKKHRALKAVGIIHAKGYIMQEDKPAFDRLVDKAVDKVVEVLKDASD